MADLNPFASLISQIEGYRPDPKLRTTKVNPYDRIIALERLAKGERSCDIAEDLGVTKDTVEGWKRAAREAWRG
ncbi:helix-turn-helix domain-containing protein [Castellaniella ginsengisoli]|uniref:Helix-turn-helix domain-containing protein n=1 Tax=Castellaniella ginsengisoli TaxID=546114 RepID=A0AB39D3E6_9BURK